MLVTDVMVASTLLEPSLSCKERDGATLNVMMGNESGGRAGRAEEVELCAIDESWDGVRNE